MKKLVSLLLVVLLMTTCLPSAFAETEGGLPPMNTTDPIHLTFVDEAPARVEVYRIMAEKFTEKYPNITIDVIQITDSYNTGLDNLFASGQKIDMGCAYYYAGGNCYNRVCYDLTEFVENDPEYQKIYPGLQSFGYYDGEHCLTIPGNIRPYMIFADQTAYEKANIVLPTNAEMTAEMLLDMMDDTTDPSSGMFTLSGSYWLPEMMCASMTENAKANFGWDGEKLDLTAYAELVDYAQELIADGHYTWNGEANYKAVQPDDSWIGLSTRIGLYFHDFTTWSTMLDYQWKNAYGVKYVPYFMPVSSEVENGGQQTFVASYFISANCEYPREAYEALKWMVWGEEGWMEKLEIIPRLCVDKDGKYYVADEAYQELEARLIADGKYWQDYVAECTANNVEYNNYYHWWIRGTCWELPPVRTDALMEKVISLYPDLGHWNDWEGLFATLTNPVPDVRQCLLGWEEFNSEVFFKTDYNGWNDYMWAGMRGVIVAQDYVDILNNGFAACREAALEKYQAAYNFE